MEEVNQKDSKFGTYFANLIENFCKIGRLEFEHYLFKSISELRSNLVDPQLFFKSWLNKLPILMKMSIMVRVRYLYLLFLAFCNTGPAFTELIMFTSNDRNIIKNFLGTIIHTKRVKKSDLLLEVMETLNFFSRTVGKNTMLNDFKIMYVEFRLHFNPKIFLEMSFNDNEISKYWKTVLVKQPKLKRWQENSFCEKCNKQFIFLMGRHHCRICGNSFCNKCCRNFAANQFFGFSTEVRHCNRCYSEIIRVATTEISKEEKIALKKIFKIEPKTDKEIIRNENTEQEQEKQEQEKQEQEKQKKEKQKKEKQKKEEQKKEIEKVEVKSEKVSVTASNIEKPDRENLTDSSKID
ncbi:MAG: hypothetical protein MHPSP_001995, partial [Paramarteilia canceri]